MLQTSCAHVHITSFLFQSCRGRGVWKVKCENWENWKLKKETAVHLFDKAQGTVGLQKIKYKCIYPL